MMEPSREREEKSCTNSFKQRPAEMVNVKTSSFRNSSSCNSLNDDVHELAFPMLLNDDTGFSLLDSAAGTDDLSCASSLQQQVFTSTQTESDDESQIWELPNHPPERIEDAGVIQEEYPCQDQLLKEQQQDSAQIFDDSKKRKWSKSPAGHGRSSTSFEHPSPITIASKDDDRNKQEAGGKWKEAKTGKNTHNYYERNEDDEDEEKNKPKRPVSAYNIFFKCRRRELVSQHRILDGARRSPKQNKRENTLTFSDIGKIIGEQWKATSPEDRNKYMQEAKRDQIRYREEMAAWKKKRRVRRLQKTRRDRQEHVATTAFDNKSKQRKCRRVSLHETEEESGQGMEQPPVISTLRSPTRGFESHPRSSKTKCQGPVQNYVEHSEEGTKGKESERAPSVTDKELSPGTSQRKITDGYPQIQYCPNLQSNYSTAQEPHAVDSAFTSYSYTPSSENADHTCYSPSKAAPSFSYAPAPAQHYQYDHQHTPSIHYRTESPQSTMPVQQNGHHQYNQNNQHQVFYHDNGDQRSNWFQHSPASESYSISTKNSHYYSPVVPGFASSASAPNSPTLNVFYPASSADPSVAKVTGIVSPEYPSNPASSGYYCSPLPPPTDSLYRYTPTPCYSPVSVTSFSSNSNPQLAVPPPQFAFVPAGSPTGTAGIATLENGNYLSSTSLQEVGGAPKYEIRYTILRMKKKKLLASLPLASISNASTENNAQL